MSAFFVKQPRGTLGSGARWEWGGVRLGTALPPKHQKDLKCDLRHGGWCLLQGILTLKATVFVSAFSVPRWHLKIYFCCRKKEKNREKKESGVLT